MLDVLYWILLVLYVPACVGLIVIVLLQKGKGTGFAGAFGIGAGSETVFGPRARRSLPVRLTYVAAGTFMVIALLMSMISGRVGKGSAPELAQVSEQEIIGTTTLDDLGLGSGKAGAAESASPEAATGSEGATEAEVESLAPGDTESLGAQPAEPAPAPAEASPAEEGASEAAPAEAQSPETPAAEGGSETPADQPAPSQAEENPPNE